MAVDKIWRGLPDLQKKVLRAEYPARHEFPFYEHGRVGVARVMRVRLADYEDALCKAIGRVWDAFEGKR